MLHPREVEVLKEYSLHGIRGDSRHRRNMLSRIQSIYEKTNLHSRSEVIQFAFWTGLLKEDVDA